MAEAPPLALLQEWFYRSMTHAGDVGQGAAEAAQALGIAQRDAAGLVRASGLLDAGARLAIYHNAYHLRLMEVLEAEYPALRLALGEVLFGRFALFFLQRRPPASHTLYALSAGFPDFLDATVPAQDRAAGWPQFMIELARLERTFHEVYRGPGLEGLSRTAAQLRPAPSLRLMRCAYPVHDFLLATRTAASPAAPAWPAPHATRLALCRQDYQVRIHALGEDEYDCLEACLATWPLDAAGPWLDGWRAHGFVG